MKFAPLVVLLFIAACAGDRTDDEDNGAERMGLVVTASIGGPDELRPEYEFGRISGLALLDDERVAVADVLNDVVRVYDAAGAHVMSFGRRGAGPGEFSGVCCVAVAPDGRVWVRDGGNGRYNIFELHADSAAYRGLARMAHSDLNRHAPLTFDRAGNIIDIGTRADPATGQHRPYRLHLDADSRVVAEQAIHRAPDDSTAMKAVQRPVEGGTMTLYSYQPFGPQELVAHSPTGEFAHALSSRYAIDWRNEDGSLLRHVSGSPADGPPLSAREREQGEKELVATVQRLGVGRTQLGFDLPARKPPLRSLFFDRDGRLWVELEVPEGSPRSAHVYDRSGTHVSSVTWPHDVSLTHGAIRGETMWGVRRDSLGVQSLVRLTAERTR